MLYCLTSWYFKDKLQNHYLENKPKDFMLSNDRYEGSYTKRHNAAIANQVKALINIWEA